MPALFRPSANAGARAAILAAVCVVAGVPLAAMAWVRTPNADRRFAPVAQPIAFDHRIHVTGQGIDCRYCHFEVERAAMAGLPPSTTCVACHSAVWMRSSALALVRHSVATGRPLQWNRVYALPDFVYFNHAIHVNKGVGCESCHGRVDRMGAVYQAVPLTMAWCVSCHTDPAAQLRPVSAMTTMGYVPAEAQRTLGARLMREYRVRELTNCTTCHR